MSRSRLAPLGLALACAAALLAWAVADLPSVLQGWLIAAMAWIGVPLGSLILLLVHSLTGGRWGEAMRPVLLPASSLLWLAAGALVPAAIGLPTVFSWAGAQGAAPPGVGALYLNGPGMLSRTVVALAGWIFLAVLVRGGPSTRVGALGLLFSALAISAFAVDWVLSIDPGYPSSAFPALFAVEKVVSALAFCAVALPAHADERDRSDLAGLLVAGLLGIVYLGLMTYVVAWYGNLPDKAAWYLRRSGDGWTLLLLAALVPGALLPVLALLSGRIRRSAAALRILGVLVLAGIVLHTAWLMAPAFGWSAVLSSLLGLGCLSGLSLGLHRSPAPSGAPAHA